ncbi:MAG: hypothetical protein QXF25_00960, partial [Candidatus Pacearchaeota archaeon]
IWIITIDIIRMAIETLFVSYEGPQDPNDPDDLRYGKNQEESFVEFIQITASYLIPPLNESVAYCDSIRTKLTPRQFLEGLEKLIETRAGWKPKRRDILAINTLQDRSENMKYAFRHITYFSVDPKSKKGKMTKEEKQEIVKMHRVISSIYKEFLKSVRYINGHNHSNKNGN